jgi:hypothetical protein
MGDYCSLTEAMLHNNTFQVDGQNLVAQWF